MKHPVNDIVRDMAEPGWRKREEREQAAQKRVTDENDYVQKRPTPDEVAREAVQRQLYRIKGM